MMLLSFVSYGQPLDETRGQLSGLFSTNGCWQIEIKSTKYGGVGFIDFYSTKNIWEDKITNYTDGVGIYYVSPTYKGFDVSIGGGSMNYHEKFKYTSTSGDYVKGYYRSNGTYVNSYYRNGSGAMEYETSILKDSKSYFVCGMSKSIKIPYITDMEEDGGFFLQMKTDFMFHSNFATIPSIILTPKLYVGIKMAL